MRIVAGSMRGRTIDAPTGNDTRPTTDRVREALFSSLYSLRGGFDGAIVLDGFSGSGALGLEALSRGAQYAVFYERDSKAAAVLKRNVEACKLDGGRARVMRDDILKSPPKGQKPPFDLILLDPPYAEDASVVLGMVSQLASCGAVGEDAIVVYEHALKSSDDVARAFEDAGIEVHASKKYGKTAGTIGIMRA